MVLVFKTTVKSKKAVKQISPVLDQVIQNSRWNFDLQDCDKILRVESPPETTPLIIQALQTRGYECAEL